MRVDYVTLSQIPRSFDGPVVVVDVLRAFTLGAFALADGAQAICCVGSVDDAFAVRDTTPSSLAMGEVQGRPVPGFDLGNSPSMLHEVDLEGRLLVHRTSAGTQGLVAAAGAAPDLFAASFICARATAAALKELAADHVTFVVTGVDHRDGEEDLACADYIATLLLSDDDTDPQPYLRRVRSSDAAQTFYSDDPDFPPADVAMALRLDAVDFALRAELRGGRPTLTAYHPALRGSREVTS